MRKMKWPLWAALPMVLIGFCFACASNGDSASGASKDFLSTVAWDAEYDVVVVGFGGAGAVSAVTAADSGAKTLLLEKAPEGHEGGNSRYAFQLMLMPKDRENAVLYFKGMRSGFTNQTDDIIDFIVDGSMGNMAWFEKMGMPRNRFGVFPMVEYPELPGGKESVVTYLIDGDASWTSTLYKFLHKLVTDRKDKIDVWYAAPAARLIQDRDTRIIHGVIVEKDGKSYNVRAKNGVILACGGFENNREMLQNFVQIADGHSKGAQYNTGDGVKMAMDVGADLWHMSAMSGPDINFINPATGNAQNYTFNNENGRLNYNGFGSTSMIIVGNNGRRFMNDSFSGRHGHVNIGGSWISLPIPQNAWCVLDESARIDRPAYPQWSVGMTEEIAKGWVLKGNTIRELAEKMGVDPAGLEAQINEYNNYCRSGKDPQFGRNPAAMKPLARGPYYAFPVKPSLTNTQGGPKRNVQCEILDVWGKPIPHLYSAGELGSFYTDIYNGGGNLSECIFTGRVAGANAAAAKKDVSSATALSGKGVDLRPAPFKPALEPNEYLGTGMGMGVEMTLKVTYAGGKITGIDFLRFYDTPGVCDRAVTEIPRAIIAANSTKVDIVAGATATSRGIIQAVEDALSKAR